MNPADTSSDNHTKCHPKRPCHRWRTCERCARIRQARIANAAETLFNISGILRWTIIYTGQSDQMLVKKLRNDWLKAANPTGAIWTVEQSRKNNNFHVNVLTPAKDTTHNFPAETWNRIITGNPRHVGAYIGKRSQMPSRQQYEGRLYGTAGTIWQILTSQTQYPIIAAAATQNLIDRCNAKPGTNTEQIHQSAINRAKWAKEAEEERRSREPTMADYRAIAARYLPDLLERVHRSKP